MVEDAQVYALQCFLAPATHKIELTHKLEYTNYGGSTIQMYL